MRTLTESAGAEVFDVHLQARPKPDPATFIGSGKVAELARLVEAHEIDLLIFDNDLSPTQLRNVERAVKCRVIDRTQLILDIFASRARTREGQLQVELAQLQYLLPRLSGMGSALSRLGGGIGTRGPGETKLELDRRKIGRRIKKLSDDLEKVRNTRDIQRKQRQEVPLATISLVGYTNAGKSTMFNRLTGAGVVADERMFATLDPTVRQIVLPSKRRVLLSDTVGFISNLPTTLVKAFRATLEEVVQSTLLLHVVDASSAEAAHHTAHVTEVLHEIGAGETPQILVLNKTDRLASTEDRQGIAERLSQQATLEDGPKPAVLFASGLTGDNLDQVLQEVDRLLTLDAPRWYRIRFPLAAADLLSLLHRRGQVRAVAYDEDACTVEAAIPQRMAESLRPRVSSMESLPASVAS